LRVLPVRTTGSGNAPWGEPSIAARRGGKGGAFEAGAIYRAGRVAARPAPREQHRVAGVHGCTKAEPVGAMLLPTFGETKVTPAGGDSREARQTNPQRSCALSILLSSGEPIDPKVSSHPCAHDSTSCAQSVLAAIHVTPIQFIGL
jgi:hypothetical protein